MILEKFRVFGATKAAKGLLLVLILSFGAWGIESFLGAQSSPHGLSINGQNISLLELEEAFKAKTRQLEETFGSTPTPEQLQGLQLPEQILAETVARTVLRQAAAGLHLQPATRALQAEISALPPFQNQAGQFDATQYRTALAQLGRTPAQFETEMAQDLAVRNLANLVQMAQVSATLAAVQAAVGEATLEVAVATLQPVPSTATPTPEQLKYFYELNPTTYTVPEHRSGLLLELSAASLSGTIVVPEARIAQEYQANQAAYSTPETRLVRHILLASLASATEVQKSVTTLEQFTAKANEVSIDPGNFKSKGGSLGYIKKAEVVPGFAEMAFGLPINRLSTPVQTPFGWHLLWVEEIRPAQVQPLTEVKSAIAQALQENELQEALNQLATRADDALAGGASLAEVAKSLGLKTKPLPRVAATDESLPKEVLAALFNTPQGQTSAPITLAQNGVAYIETTQVEVASVPALAQIEARVVADWRALQTELANKAAAESLLNAARAPATGQRSLTAAAAQAKVNASFNTLSFKGVAEAPRWLQPKLRDLMAAAKGAVLPATVREGDAYHVVQLVGRVIPPVAAATAPLASTFKQEMKQDLEALLVAHLQANAKVTCNTQGLAQVFGYAPACPQ